VLASLIPQGRGIGGEGGQPQGKPNPAYGKKEGLIKEGLTPKVTLIPQGGRGVMQGQFWG